MALSPDTATGTGTAGPVGLFGGSFDPPHLAHLSLARTALQQLGLAGLRWLPAGQPWQKKGRTLASPAHRLAMVQALVAGEPRFVVDTTELDRPGPSYMIDTVEALQLRFPERREWFLVIGQDQYARLASWHRWQELLKRLTLAVAARAGQAVSAAPEVAAVAHRVVRLDMPALEISSTLVRGQCQRGEDITPMVGDGVARYIAQHRLYSEH
ncbi:nicotinate-nucleotide adenylyltransferase [Pelomonas sp. APW6]|uniref:Probable nicotinate-nucleotide adenylyltransferase n=1 Tax=Roseateles subflavus TaxID=3053353 RepID=A0ABT7LND9_9BURK|nr:nicotinate-nucleotide adenylyltransferase [Pelomonas sp. APW6]MDL5033670.1 nicotinate-nucleotide adenylyltransferase [Pelomonas sp. APW6]